MCATDLARRHLPFPLPQVTGHEVIALDAADVPVAVEINASHAARGVAARSHCPCCTGRLATHCPERLVLGIHALPGGFGPWLLAPVDSVVPLPADLSPATATLIEPFAAALHAVDTLAPRDGDRVAVLGPGRLGALVIAALAARRGRDAGRFTILALARRGEMRELALALGADDAIDPSAPGLHDLAEVVIDTTGSPHGLPLALALATREVHVKSTTGQPAIGLVHPTELVVDELTVIRWGDDLRGPLSGPRPRVAALLGDVPASVRAGCARQGLRVVEGDDAGALAAALARDPGAPLGAADVAVVGTLAGVDAAIRPRAGVEQGLVRARGTIAVADVGQPRTPLLAAVLDKGLRLSATRCGDLRAGVRVLAQCGAGLGERLVTDRLPPERLADALVRAADRRALKVVVSHPDGLLGHATVA